MFATMGFLKKFKFSRYMFVDQYVFISKSVISLSLINPLIFFNTFQYLDDVVYQRHPEVPIQP